MRKRTIKLMFRRLAVLMVALSVSLSWAPEASTQTRESSDSSEYLIKAGFIFNFAKFVEWPTAAFPQPDSPIVIGILGTDPFGTIIHQIVQDKKVGARGFVVKRLTRAAELKQLKECKILFVGASERAHLDELVQIVKGLPILTV